MVCKAINNWGASLNKSKTENNLLDISIQILCASFEIPLWTWNHSWISLTTSLYWSISTIPKLWMLHISFKKQLSNPYSKYYTTSNDNKTKMTMQNRKLTYKCSHTGEGWYLIANLLNTFFKLIPKNSFNKGWTYWNPFSHVLTCTTSKNIIYTQNVLKWLFNNFLPFSEKFYFRPFPFLRGGGTTQKNSENFFLKNVSSPSFFIQFARN